eukprot:gb/GEZN01011487.1/.p1 GENE.gb/GEZN01011487.1/~~gb/GEZN01011487.1/.p1  ORF type:complete len:174 (-),score=14.13 gb/GEZN01011487.1/:27-548(-)
MSLGGSFSQSSNDAVNAVTQSGTLVIVAAGNDDANACNYSPSAAGQDGKILSVGSTTQDDRRSVFSNYGPCVNIFAPGSQITAAYIGSPTTTAVLSGTSMACPHVVGVALKLLSADPSLNAQQLRASVLQAAVQDQVLNAGESSANLLTYAVCGLNADKQAMNSRQASVTSSN